MNAPALSVLQRDLSCPGCGGQMAFAPDAQALRCGHCGATATIEATAEQAHREVCLTVADDHPPMALGTEGQVHACQTCAGEVVFLGGSLSERCPYCDGPVVRREGRGGFVPTGIAPFRVGEAGARAAIADWFRSRMLLPDVLRDRASGARIAGVYAPFWTFDSEIEVAYEGWRGRRSGKKTVWTRVSGTVRAPFDDILMPASSHITADIRDATGPWPVTSLVDFQPRYLAGFAAELHRTGAADAAEQVKEDIRPILVEKVKADIGGSRQRVGSLSIRMSGTTCRSMLLPLWILHYEHGGRRYRVIASGATGRAFGERPFCPVKLRVASLAATLVAALLGAAIGLAHAGV
jgi:ribosomal protein S27AE